MKTQPMINTQNISNDLLSMYPVLVHNSYVVKKSNIWIYLKKLVVLYKEKSDRFLTGKTLEKLVAGKLHLLTVSSTKQNCFSWPVTAEQNSTNSTSCKGFGRHSTAFNFGIKIKSAPNLPRLIGQ